MNKLHGDIKGSANLFRRAVLRGICATLAFVLSLHFCHGQTTEELLKSLEPGIGYAKFKQWANDNKLVF
jgi:hypothetical protein